MSEWPEHMRDEIAAIERETGVHFTAISDFEKCAEAAAAAYERWEKYLRWHTLAGHPRKLRKDGQPSQRGVRRSDH